MSAAEREALELAELEAAELETPHCEYCGGELCELGSLGRMLHLRCRDCGATANKPLPRATR